MVIPPAQEPGVAGVEEEDAAVVVVAVATEVQVSAGRTANSSWKILKAHPVVMVCTVARRIRRHLADVSTLGFSMRDEARNTERHTRAPQLRTLGPIVFVSAGTLEPLELLKPLHGEPAEEFMEKANSNVEDNMAGLDVGKLSLGGDSAPKEPGESQGFVMDLTGDAECGPKLKAPVVRAPSPTPSVSSSSSEKIVFVPKSRRGAPPQTKTNATTTTTAVVDSPGPVASTEPVIMTTTATTIFSSTSITLPQLSEAKAPEPEEDFVKLESNGEFKDKRATEGNKRRKPKGGHKSALDEAAKDYLENIVAQMRQEPTGSGLPTMSGDNSRWVDDSSTDEDEELSDLDAVRRYKCSWTDERLEEFDEVATDDATWVPAAILDSSVAAHIESFEACVVKWSESSGCESSGGKDKREDIGEDIGEDEGDEEHNEDLDIQLARALQKQEEVLEAIIVDSVEIVELDDDFLPTGQRHKQKIRKSRKGLPTITPNPRSGHYPSASKMAEAYDGLVMEWERPSLVNTKKGKGKIPPIFNLSDSEMEAQISTSWQRDRQKKKLRKIERQQLRAQGILNKKARHAGQPSLVGKYKGGMTVAQAKTEINSFLFRGDDRCGTQSLSNGPPLTLHSLSLPPMSKPDRKAVHALASKHKLKSKSDGKGAERHITLIKPSRSGRHDYDEEGVGPNIHHDKLGDRGGKKGLGGGGGSRFPRDGMRVGAEAPELSADNRGRIMLEKMGYRTGMTLGAVEGRGISEPLIAIVKWSKAGLG